MHCKIRLIILIVLMTCTQLAFSSEELTIKQANQLKDIASPLKGSDPTILDDSDLAALDKVIGNSRIVGLGEDTHGTHEFFQMKHRLLQYLVQKKGFTIFSIEASMPQAYRLNDYVLDGKGDPKKLIADMGFWTWDTEELLAMVKWMYIYNQTAEKKIKFTGFDMQSQPDNYKTNITDRLNKAGREDESQTMNQIITDIDPVNQKSLEYYHAIEKVSAEEESAFNNYSQLLTEKRQQKRD